MHILDSDGDTFPSFPQRILSIALPVAALLVLATMHSLPIGHCPRKQPLDTRLVSTLFPSATLVSTHEDFTRLGVCVYREHRETTPTNWRKFWHGQGYG